MSICIAPSAMFPLRQWFLTGGTRTPWGYEALKQGVRSTKLFLGYTPENKKCVFDCCECSKLYQRPCLESPYVRSFFITKLGFNAMFFSTQKWGGYPVFECLLVFELYKEIEQFLRHRGSGSSRALWKWGICCVLGIPSRYIQPPERLEHLHSGNNDVHDYS